MFAVGRSHASPPASGPARPARHLACRSASPEPRPATLSPTALATDGGVASTRYAGRALMVDTGAAATTAVAEIPPGRR
ncbi:MAG: hypothetical protein QOK20_723 [Acidimicrobiaceae bacterium]|jgi:hypothetical protein|nr:hypothetical protein [Acidimicrobiaceae bacterium]